MHSERYLELRKDEHTPSFGFNIKGGYETGAQSEILQIQGQGPLPSTSIIPQDDILCKYKGNHSRLKLLKYLFTLVLGCPVYVWRVEPGSLADRYGLKSGDEILQANGIDFTHVEHGEALKLLKGQNTLCLYIRPRCDTPVVTGSGQPLKTPQHHHPSVVSPAPALPPPSTQTSLDYPLNSSMDDEDIIYTNAEFYTWVDRYGAPVSPPRLNESWPKRNVDIEIQPGQNLGLMIRGGNEYGLGIYVTGVDPGSVAERAGLQRGDEIIEVNGLPFTSITHDKAVQILKSNRKMSILASHIGKIPADLTFEPQVKLVEDDIDKCANILVMIEEKARTVLTKSEHSRFTFYREEYQQGFLPVQSFVRILLELLSTHEKYTLLTEVRELIRPADRMIFDELIYKPSFPLLGYIPPRESPNMHLDRSPVANAVNGANGHNSSDLLFLREFANTTTTKGDPMSRSSPATPNPPYVQDGSGQLCYSSTPAVRYRVRIQKTKALLGIAIEGGINTPHRLPRIININEEGCAYNSNLKPGQVLLAVDGKPLDGLTHEEIARHITEAFSDTSKAGIEFMVVEAKHSNLQQQRQQDQQHHLHPSQQNHNLTPSQQQQQQPSSLVLCSNN